MPCVGTSAGLLNQMRSLDQSAARVDHFPAILDTSGLPQREFAWPSREMWDVWTALQQQAEMPFDLLYAPRAFELLIHSANVFGKSAGQSTDLVGSALLRLQSAVLPLRRSRGKRVSAAEICQTRLGLSVCVGALQRF